MISYNQAIKVIKQFADAHWQIEKFGFEFKEQMPNIATLDERYPMLFVCPVGSATLTNTREFEIDVYCMDRLMQDRDNSTSIVSDTDLILADFTKWLEEGQDDIDVIKAYTATPINNDLLDYCAGWVMRVRLEVDRIGLCEIPMDEVGPSPGGECDPVSVQNSDSSYSVIVGSGGKLTLPDTTYNIYLDSVLDQSVSIPTLKNETINILL